MADGADFELRLKDKLSAGIGRATSKLNKFRAALRKADAGTGRLKAGLSKLKSRFSGVGSAASRLGAVAGVALAAVGIAAGAAVIAVGKLAASFAKAAIQAASFGQKAELALGLLLKSPAKGRAELQKIMKVAADLGLPIQETTKQFQKLLAMQFKPAAATDIIKMSSDLRAIGAGADEVKRAVLAITQIKSKGRVQSDELLQLAEAGVSQELIFKKLGKTLGKTRAEVRKLLETGKIDSKTGLAAIGEAIKEKAGIKNFGDAGKKFADSTLEGMAGKFKARGQLAMLQFGKAILPELTEVAKNAGVLMDRLTENPAVQQFVGKVKNLFNEVLKSVNRAMPGIEKFITNFAKNAGPGIDTFTKALKGLNWTDINQGLGMMGSALGHIFTGMSFGVTTTAAVAKGFFRLLSAVDYVVTGVSGFVGRMRDVVLGNMRAMQISMTTIGQNVVAGFTAGFKNAIPSAVAAANSLASQVTGAVKGAFQQKSPSKLFAQIGKFNVEGLQQGMTTEAPRVQSVTADMFKKTTKDAVASETSAPSGGGGMNIGDITINVSGGDGSAASIGAAVRSEFEGVLQEYALSAGLA